MKIIFSQSNLSRKPEFQITTKIIKDKNKIFVRKEIVDPQAIKFLNQLYKNQLLIKKNLIGIEMAKIINKTNDYLDFQYLHLPSFEYLIEEALIYGHYQKAQSFYLYFLDFINKQPTINYKYNENKKFKSIFLDPLEEVINEDDFLKFGILDLNLDNLLYDEKNKKLFLIDWEWFFDFPIPKDFVVFRSLFYLCAHLQMIIKTLCSENFPCLEIVKDFFIPKVFFQLYPFSPKQVKIFLTMENNFQHFVLAIPPKYDQNIFLDNFNEKTTPDGKNANLKAQQTEQNLSKNNIEIEILKQEIEPLRLQLEKIQSSKTYKIWQGYCKIRDKILKKLGIKNEKNQA